MEDSPEPMVLRPSRRPLFWVIPMLALTAVATAMSADPDSPPGSEYLALLAILLTFLTLKLLRGRTEAGPDGLRNRMVRSTRTIAWRDVSELSVMPTLFGRIVQVVDTGGGRINLAAPRDGLLGRDRGLDETLDALAALAAPHEITVNREGIRAGRIMWWGALAAVIAVGTWLSQPWLEPWWPGRAEASTSPRACAVIGEPDVRRLVPDGHQGSGRHTGNEHSTVSECELDGEASSLDLELRLEHRSYMGGIEKAREAYDIRRESEVGAGSRPPVTAGDVPGLGDQAWQRIRTDEDSAFVSLMVRENNVLIRIDYRTDRPARQAAADAAAVARIALARFEHR